MQDQQTIDGQAGCAGELMKGVLPYIVLEQADEAIAFYEKAFGAELMSEPVRDDRARIMNACVVINGGVMMMMHHAEDMCGEATRTGGGFTLQLVVEDGDLWWNRAVAAGCEVVMPFEAQFWGDRYGRLRDPFGLDWALDEPAPEKRQPPA